MSDESPIRDTLVRRFVAGEEAAFREVLVRYGPVLRHFAESLLPDRMRRRVSAADLVQDACLVASEKRGEFEDRGEGSLRNWLFRIVEYRVRDSMRRHLRADRRSLGRETPRGERGDTEDLVARATTPSQIAVGAEMEEIARRALMRLSESDREILHLVREERLGYDEIARRRGKSPVAMRKAYSRALARFQGEFEGLGGVDAE